MKTENEIMLIGLKEYRDDVLRKVKIMLRKYEKVTLLTVFDLNSISNDISKYRAELAEIESRINKLEPQFNADDIPF
jgi:hypothetical protein